MSSSRGGNLRQWKLLVQIQNYFSKSNAAISLESLQGDLARILRLSSPINKETSLPALNSSSIPPTTKIYETKASSKEEIKGNVQQTTKKNDIKTPSNEDTHINYSDVKKALQALNGLIPQMPSVNLRSSKSVEKKAPLPKWLLKKREIASKSSVDARTRHLVRGLDSGLSDNINSRRIEEVCTHLKMYPFSRGAATKCFATSRLLNILHTTSDENLQDSVRETLALMGHVQPVTGQGIRILSIDGGGIRGLVALEVLAHLEEKSGKPIHELFDFICGVSTGAVIAVLVGAHRMPLPECKELYRDLSLKIFSQTTLKGTTNLVWKNSFYDSDAWTEILKEKMGDVPMIETSRDSQTTKLCFVSTQANANWIKPYLFRNYNFPIRVASHFNGSSSNMMWEGVRASAAAPAYFSEFRVKDLVLLDGGVLVNNPTAISIHETRQLWPNTAIQTVVSVGTGRHEPLALVTDNPVNWAMRLRSIVNSATDTEGVHTTLNDLLAGDVYFRMNPYLSEEISLDEIRPNKLSVMIEDTNLYLRKNENKISETIASLMRKKSYTNIAMDAFHLKRQMWAH